MKKRVLLIGIALISLSAFASNVIITPDIIRNGFKHPKQPIVAGNDSITYGGQDISRITANADQTVWRNETTLMG